MDNEYIFIKDGLAFTVYVVTSDLANGRFQIFSAALNNVHHGVYESVAECEALFDRWVEEGRFECWAKKWNANMPRLGFK